MKLIEVKKIGGLKCDCCDYRNDTVKYEDYRFWINRSCPKCGANLLTKADYKAARRLMRAVKIIMLDDELIAGFRDNPNRQKEYH